MSLLDKYQSRIDEAAAVADDTLNEGDERLDERSSASDRRKSRIASRKRRRSGSVKRREKLLAKKRKNKRKDPARSRAAKRGARIAVRSGHEIETFSAIQEAADKYLSSSVGKKLESVLELFSEGGATIDESHMSTLIEGINGLTKAVLTSESAPMDASLIYYREFVLPVYEQIQLALDSFLSEGDLNMEAFDSIVTLTDDIVDPEVLDEHFVDGDDLDEDCIGEDCD